MKEAMNKKGQQFSTTTLLVIVIGIIALIVVIIGFSQGWSFIFDKLGFLPDDLNSAAVACKSYAGEGSLALSYCQYRELTIDGQKQWVNCNHIRIEALKVLGEGKVDFEAQTCENQDKYCSDVLQKKIGYEGKGYVNGVLCPKI